MGGDLDVVGFVDYLILPNEVCLLLFALSTKSSTGQSEYSYKSEEK